MMKAEYKMGQAMANKKDFPMLTPWLLSQSLAPELINQRLKGCGSLH